MSEDGIKIIARGNSKTGLGMFSLSHLFIVTVKSFRWSGRGTL